jgi:hypothetical protein
MGLRKRDAIAATAISVAAMTTRGCGNGVQDDDRQRRNDDALEDLVRLRSERELGNARDEDRRTPEDRKEHRHEHDLEEERVDVRDATSCHDVAEEQPRQSLGEQERVIRTECGQLSDPASRAPEVQRLRSRERQRNREEKNPTHLAGRQIEERREQIRNEEEKAGPSHQKALQTNRQQWNQQKEERGADVVGELGVALDRNKANGHGRGRRQIAEEQCDGEEDPTGETERRDPGKCHHDAGIERLACHSVASVAAVSMSLTTGGSCGMRWSAHCQGSQPRARKRSRQS